MPPTNDFMLPQYLLESLRERAASARRKHNQAAEAGICPYLPKLPIEEEYEKALQGTGMAHPSEEIPTPTPLQVIGSLLQIIENARWAILAIDRTGDTSRDLEAAPRTSGWEDLLCTLRKKEQETYNLGRKK